MRNIILTRLGRRFEITGHPPVGTVGAAYSYTFGTTGGSGSITWTCTSLGSSGATFSAGTLSSASLINGGTYPFTLTATDANRQTATANFVLIVLGASIYQMVQQVTANRMLTQSGRAMRPQ